MMKNIITTFLAGSALFLASCASGNGADNSYQGIAELDEVPVGFEAPGRVASVHVVRGQGVADEQVLARLDDALAVTRRNARQAELKVAKAHPRRRRTVARLARVALEGIARQREVRGA